MHRTRRVVQVVQAKSSAWLSPNLLPESLPSAALDQAQFGLLNAKADFALGTASSLRGSQASSLLSQEIGADADVQEMRPDRHGLAMSLRHQAQLELAQATADEAAAEAVAADELRKADEAMLRAKALSKALAKGEAEELMDILKAPFSPVQDLVSDSKAILLSTETAVLEAPEEAAGNSTEAAARSCDPTVGLSCRAQRAILLWLAFPYCLSSTLRGPVKAANATHDLSTVKTVKTPPTVATAAVALWSAGPAKSLTQMLQEPRSVQHLRIQLPSAGEVTGHLIILATLMTAAALTFRYMAKWPEVDESMMPKEKLSSWSSGPFDCFEDMNICCWTCWCPGVRWAGNMDMMGFLKFWPAFFLFLFFDLMPAIPFCSCLCCGWCAVLTYYRLPLSLFQDVKGASQFQAEF
ncbi:unnamed protein product [Durusdinium trenchii]|uniref:Uncharacterized protein n=1 Tax=Durusdinium trenchii TaxID=1381693 RepID=A0ABP0H737_9DINO